MTREIMKDTATWIKRIIQDFIQSPANTLRNPENDPAWAGPLVGFCRGDDPLFADFKRYVGAFHWTPLEIFHKTFPLLQATAADLAVVSWVLPQTKKTKADLRKETRHPSESWARARIFGEEANVKLRRHVEAALQAAGVEAVAPMLSPLWEMKKSERFDFASTWSERHAAYAAGLGTFGLCDGLITAKGKAMRCGSVIARFAVPPASRPYHDYRAYCLFFAQGTCGKCIDRCPAGAVTREGHDKRKCLAYLEETAAFVKSHFGFDGYGCGFCQTGVPCESRIPVKDR
jgi:epoxyqueuosine reductase